MHPDQDYGLVRARRGARLFGLKQVSETNTERPEGANLQRSPATDTITEITGSEGLARDFEHISFPSERIKRRVGEERAGYV